MPAEYGRYDREALYGYDHSAKNNKWFRDHINACIKRERNKTLHAHSVRRDLIALAYAKRHQGRSTFLSRWRARHHAAKESKKLEEALEEDLREAEAEGIALGVEAWLARGWVIPYGIDLTGRFRGRGGF